MDRIVLRGGPFARGQQYGRLAKQKILRCIESYREAFRHRTGLDWDAALAQARRFERDIAPFSPDSMQEMRGIAEGAGVQLDPILALNCRSELMFAAARKDEAGECTSFAVLPEASANGHMLLGQNWDWLPFAAEVCVLVEAQRDDKPSYATVVEAGMLAKVGFNAAGLGVCTNTLVSTRDAPRRGVPYHVMLRALLDAETLEAAGHMLLGTERALSANYLVADKSGVATNFETTAGGGRNVRATQPVDGLLAHANHFLAPDFASVDFYVSRNPHSVSRLEAMRRELRERNITTEKLRAILRGHEGAPNGICSHPDPKAHPLSARATIASVVADLATGEVWMTAGPPCINEYERYSLQALERASPRAPGSAPAR